MTDEVTIEVEPESAPIAGKLGTTPPAGKSCDQPIIKYEDLTGKTQHERLLFMRSAYESALSACTGTSAEAEDSRQGFEQALTNINNGLVDIDDGMPTSKAALFTSFYGTAMDKLDPRTRRSTPWGTVATELDTYIDNIDVKTTDPIANFEVNTPDNTPDPDFKGIDYVPSKVTDNLNIKGLSRKFIDFKDENNKDKYSEKHESCLKDLPCTFEDFKQPIVKTSDVKIKDKDIDVGIADEDITSGCVNGEGLFDKLMTAIDSSIDMQFKNSRLDNKTFGEFYAATISAAMQQTTQFLVQKEQLKLDALKVELEYDKFEHSKDKAKYDTALVKAQVEKLLLEIELFKKQAPIQLAKLTQETKLAEKTVEATTRQIESTKATIVATYNDIGEKNATNKFERERIKAVTEKVYKDTKETTADGVLNRNLTTAKIEQTRIGIKIAKFDTIMKKYQAYATKVQIEESKATGAANRRVMAADVQSKNKMASLYDQQRKTFVYGQRTDVLKIMKDMWNVQIDTLGPEGMAVEAIKGPEFSSRLERAALDVGV